jgi:predicted kinase
MDILQQKFIELYNNVLVHTPLFKTMEQTIEASPWHREANVLVHTNMVVANYIGLVKDEWYQDDVLGAFACAFHDVGKPAAEEIKFSESRGTYRSYPGHELISARLWVDYAMANLGLLQTYFPEFNDTDIFIITWMIEKHLPYELKDVKKLEYFYTSLLQFAEVTFYNVLRADAYGRISDNSDEKIARVDDWIFDTLRAVKKLANTIDVGKLPDKVLTVLIGPSGSGKSTYVASQPGINEPFSYDALRLSEYGNPALEPKEQYRQAYAAAEADATFYNRANNVFTKLIKQNHPAVIVDGINASSKKRKFFIDTARKQGYKIRAVYFLNTIETTTNRQKTRDDKELSTSTIRNQYFSIQAPSFGEFDEIYIEM